MPATPEPPRHGGLTLTAKERASLHVSRIITDRLIDDLLPTIEYVALIGLGRVDGETREVWQAEARRQADTARAFCTLLESPTRLGHAYFVGRWIGRGLPRDDAERRFAHLLGDLEELEAHLRHQATDGRPGRGNRVDAQVDHLVHGAAACWRQHTGQEPSGRLIVEEPGGQPRTRISAGALPYYSVAVFYDAGANVVGVRPR